MVLSAKVTPPHIAACIQRLALFARLDSLTGRPVTWVTAPAGAGKTILVASYLQRQGLRPIWYQMDGHDAAPATFFHYLALAAGAASDKGVDLPSLTVEYTGSFDVFARNYFVSLAEQIDRPVLVLDDFQNLPESAPTMEILAAAMAEIPRDSRVFIVSRSAPAGPFARLVVNGVIGAVKSDELLLSVKEVTELLELLGAGEESERCADAIYQKTNGWAAGCVLVWEASQDSLQPQMLSTSSLDEIALKPPRVMFDYFGREVFSRLDEETQDVLLKTSFLPSVTPEWAQSLTAKRRAPEVLERLVDDQYFTLKRSMPDAIYVFHPLFLDFLRRHAEANLDTELAHQLKSQSAKLLAEGGQVDAAVDLWRQVEEWSQIEAAVYENAERLLAAGRNDTLLTWIGCLPERILGERPWLRLWSGLAHLPIDPNAAHAELAEAWRQFRNIEDRDGALMAWAGIMDGYNFRQDCTDFRDWMVALEELLGDEPTFSSEQLEAHVTTGLVQNLWIAWPDYPNRQRWESRAKQLVGVLPPNRRIRFQSHLLASYSWSGQFALGAMAVDELRALTSGPNILPLMRLFAQALKSMYLWFSGEWEDAVAEANAGLEISERYGVRAFDAYLHGYIAAVLLSTGEAAMAREQLSKMLSCTRPDKYWEYAFYLALVAWHALMVEDYPRAIQHKQLSQKVLLNHGQIVNQTVTHQLGAIIEYETGNIEVASNQLKMTLQLSKTLSVPSVELLCYLTTADWALDRGDQPTAVQSLEQALDLIRERQISVMMGWRRSTMARLLAFALERRLDTPLVLKLIDKYRLAPLTGQAVPAEWPRPIKIRALGNFSLELRGEPLVFTRKTQRRPIELLKALIAFGGDRVQEWQVADALWPDSDGSAAAQTLATTLHRLRKILGGSQIIERRSGALTLNRELCGVDLFEFEALLDRAPSSAASSQPGAAAMDDRSAERVLELYQPFLGQEDAAWALGCRQRLERRVLAALRGWVDERVRQGQFDRAIPIYEGALEIDRLSEDNYRGLMHCLANVGRSSEALACYQRCRDTLRDTLNAEPSKETTALYQSIQGK